jgi:hypothetical protein
LHSAWPGQWLDEDTFGFTGDVCGVSSFYTIDVDGSNLQRIVETRGSVARLSQQRDRLAYQRRVGDTPVVTVLELATRKARDYPSGDSGVLQSWSPDGKYLSFLKPGGRGGPCEFTPPQSLEVVPH